MFAQVNGVGLFGMNAFPVTAEISMTRGQPSFDIVGLPDLAVTESKSRISSALTNAGIHTESGRITVNLAPASVKKVGSMFDLPILTAILSVQSIITEDISDCAFIGELSLNGDLAFTQGALTMALAAKGSGVKRLFLPKKNAREASVVSDMEVYGVENVVQLLRHFDGTELLTPEAPYEFTGALCDTTLDFADVKGQFGAKKALETAAAGSHNLLMIGSPGSGKSMLAKRLPSILPKMTFEESIETTQIHSVAGMIDSQNPLIQARPFRNVSHTASAVGLIGGGGIPRPGEISLAHNGVLFLDEFPEFDRRVLETLRQPLENGEITISRASGSVCYPCDVMLVAAMNPCPCGNYGNPKKQCSCSPKQVAAYLNKISQPVLDRIDIQIEVAPVEFGDLVNKSKEEPSAFIAERVQKARDIQSRRFRGTKIKSNSGITADILHEVCVLTDDAQSMLKNAFERLGLSARAYDRILKVARTCADLSASDKISREHISQAISFRSLDRKYWK